MPRSTTIGNIETLYALKGSVLEEIYSYEQVRPGDIFIRGKEGEILGGGHTGIFTRKGEIIHCNAYNSTVTINNEISFIRYYLACHRSAWERCFSPIEGGEELAYIDTLGKAKVLATYHKDSTIYYDKIVEANGYGWLSYIGQQSGQRRYVAYKNKKQSWMTL